VRVVNAEQGGGRATGSSVGEKGTGLRKNVTYDELPSGIKD